MRLENECQRIDLASGKAEHNSEGRKGDRLMKFPFSVQLSIFSCVMVCSVKYSYACKQTCS